MPHAFAVAAGRRALLRERIAWRHPEWWSLALSGASWIALAARVSAGGHGQSHALVAHGHHATAIDAISQWTGALSEWTLMVVAMMVPLTIGAIRVTAERSLWRRRHRAIAEFLAGYLFVWLIAGAAGTLLLLGVRTSWPGLFSTTMPAAVALVAAAAWQLTPVKRRALRACHRTAPLAGRGWRADRDCFAYGLAIGGHCFVSCWAIMLACLVSAHDLAVMVSASVVGVAERGTSRPLFLRTAGALGLLAWYHAVAG